MNRQCLDTCIAARTAMRLAAFLAVFVISDLTPAATIRRADAGWYRPRRGPDGTSGDLLNGSSKIYTFLRQGSQWSLSDTLTVQGEGGAVALSGTTLIASTWPGAIVFARVGNSWVQQTTLVGDQPNERIDGAAVNGDIVVLLGSNGTNLARAYFVHFFARSGTVFTLENTIDVGLDQRPAFAISGQTALVGVAGGAVDAWVRDQGTWSIQGTLDAGTSYNGISVAIDGDTALVGSPLDTVLGNAAAGTAYVFTRSASVWTRSAHLYDATGRGGYQFGSALALAGNTGFIGSPTASTDAGRTGKATVFAFDSGTWSQGADLEDGNAHAEYFGESVAFSGSNLLVGSRAPSSNPNSSGAAYVFASSGGTWLEEATLRPTAEISQGFGASVAIDGDIAVVGASDEDADDDGAAYVFARNGTAWPLQARLSSSTGNTFFGWSVALAGDWLAVGEPGTNFDQFGAPPGKVHMFLRSGTDWIEQSVLLPSISSDDDQFGYSLAISGGTLFVGALLADDGIETNAGLVFVFENSGSGWAEVAHLEAPIVASGAGFGLSVAIRGNTAVVGAGAQYDLTSPRGGAYVYTQNAGSWSWQATLMPPIQPPIPGNYGHAVAVSADEGTIVVGMPYTMDGGVPGQGEAFVFTREGDTWTASSTLQGPPSTNPPYDEFGESLAFSAGDVAIGAPLDGTGGAAYVAGVGNEIFAGNFDTAP